VRRWPRDLPRPTTRTTPAAQDSRAAEPGGRSSRPATLDRRDIATRAPATRSRPATPMAQLASSGDLHRADRPTPLPDADHREREHREAKRPRNFLNVRWHVASPGQLPYRRSDGLSLNSRSLCGGENVGLCAPGVMPLREDRGESCVATDSIEQGEHGSHSSAGCDPLGHGGSCRMRHRCPTSASTVVDSLIDSVVGSADCHDGRESNDAATYG
jgi:hypothetical protein